MRGPFQVIGIACGVSGRWMNGSAGLAKLKQKQRAKRPARTSPNGRFHHIGAALGCLLNLWAHVTKQRARKEIGALWKTWHARFVDESCWLINPL